jgi:hypothetical protein
MVFLSFASASSAGERLERCLTLVNSALGWNKGQAEDSAPRTSDSLTRKGEAVSFSTAMIISPEECGACRDLVVAVTEKNWQ